MIFYVFFEIKDQMIVNVIDYNDNLTIFVI